MKIKDGSLTKTPTNFPNFSDNIQHSSYTNVSITSIDSGILIWLYQSKGYQLKDKARDDAGKRLKRYLTLLRVRDAMNSKDHTKSALTAANIKAEP